MAGLLHHLRLGLRLYFRNRMAMLYGYLFPSIFLLAFYVLYRYERVPLERHMGELLTVTILGGACFGLATTLVSERERGVWRRLRLAPLATGSLVASTLVARYVLLLTAGLVQLGLAMALGLPWPSHPLALLVAFTVASFAFLGLGLVIAMLADNVPAVQALGQCIFLPMLIIGGVAVPLTSLPDWALHLSAYFPGRYAVAAMQAAFTGDGLRSVGFSLAALGLIGVAACVAGAGLFRWDARQRFATSRGKAWLAVALAGWVGVGLAARAQGRVIPAELAAERAAQAGATTSVTAPAVPTPPPASVPVTPAPPEPEVTQAPPTTSTVPTPTTVEPATAPPSSAAPPSSTTTAATPPTPAPTTVPPAAAPAREPAPWERVTLAEINRDLVFDRLPPDSGVVTPVASTDQQVPDQETSDALDQMYAGLQTWAPGRVPDVLERARNLLFVPAVVDVFQMPMEPWVPLMVYEILERDVDREVLLKALYWIALHPDEGSDAVVDQMQSLGLRNGPGDIGEVRGRVGVYAVKLIGRITGARPGR